MQALILAAGCGSRLGEAAPKCLAEVGGRPLLRHQLDALARMGANRVTMVVGYRHDEIRSVAGGEATFVLNERFAETNSLYSFWLARPAVHEDLLILNSDVLFPAQILRSLLDKSGSSLAFDSSSGDDEEHMKVRLHKGSLVRMSKKLPPGHTHGENVGLLHLTAAAARGAFQAAASLIAAGRDRDWLASAVSAIAPAHRISGVDVEGLPWVEIDYPEDLVAARTRIWPAIQSLEPVQHRPRLLPVGWPPRSVIAEAVAT